MKKILVPCDFSEPAINAYRFALDIAKQSKGPIHLLHVIELPILHDTVLMPVLTFEEQLLKELREKTDQQFEKVITKYEKHGVKVKKDVVFGSPTLMITNYIQDNKIDLVIMGSHGASGLREVLIGSNAEKIVRRSPVPVMVLKEYFNGPINNIVLPVALDTEYNEDHIQKIKQLQAFFNATLHLVWINTPLNYTTDSETRQHLNTLVKRYMLKDYSINIFNCPNEEKGILNFSKLIKAEMIAMGTHARKGLSHLFLGSTTEDVVNSASNIIWTYTLHNEIIEA